MTGTGEFDLNTGKVAMTGGQINIQAGILGNDNFATVWTNNNAALSISSGAFLDLRGNPATIVDALTGAGTVADSYANGTNTLTVGINNGSGTFSGSITQVAPTISSAFTQTGNPIVAITKSGTGAQIFSGTNTYTGATNVNGGTLAINGTQTAATGTITIASAGTLQGTGNSGAAVITVNGTIQGGASSPGTFVFSNTNASMTINTGAAINVNVATLSSPSVSLLNLSGTSSSLNLLPSSGQFTINLTGDGSDSPGQTYNFIIASVGSSGTIKLDGTSLGIGGGVASSYYTLNETGFVNSFTSVSLMSDATSGHNLILSVTTVAAVPEPTHIMLICAGALLVGFTGRRGWRKTALGREHRTI